MAILIMTCSKSSKWLWLVQSQQNDYFNYDLFKVSKMPTMFFQLFKAAKWLVDLGLRYVCVSLRLVDLNNYSDVVYRFMISNFVLV